MRELVASLGSFCAARGLRRPSRAALYRLLERLPCHEYAAASLPPEVGQTLYNVALDQPVPGSQLAFHCFNYGGPRALSFAAGLPWLDLYQASRKPGWRPMSRSMFEAICRIRRI